MSNKLIPLMLAGLVAGIVGSAIFGALTYTTFDNWRKADLLEEEYRARKEQGEEALDAFFLKAPPPHLEGIHQPLDAEKQKLYEKAKTEPGSAMDTFFAEHVRQGGWIPWVCIVAWLLACFVFARALRGLFEAQTGKVVVVMALVGSMGSYFWLLVHNGAYPMGIDLAGGTELIYRLDYTEINQRIDDANERFEELQANENKKDPGNPGKVISRDDIESQERLLETLTESRRTASDKATEVLRKRVDPTGTKGIPITQYGEDRIRIQLPKASPEDVERIKRAIKTQGRLTFHLVTEDREMYEQVTRSENKEFGDYVLKMIEKTNPYDPTVKEEPEAVVIKKYPELEGSGITHAIAGRSPKGGYEIRLNFDPSTAAKVEKVTSDNLKKRLAIVLDGVCHLAPTIQGKFSDSCEISGNFTKREAEEIAGVLTAGSLPVAVEEESTFVVGPALGHEQVESGFIATLAAAGLVMFFMWAYYRALGFVTLVCLAVNLSVMLGALGFFRATMTLPGIAGIALTLGMAVDANVLIFERIREEIARGRTVRQAVGMGFDRALSAIVDSNLTTLISGIILYYFGTGPVRGFAVTLSLGVLMTLFANLWVCRLIVDWLVAKDALQNVKMMQLFGETNYDFMGKRRPFVLVSTVLFAASVAGFVYLGVMKNDIYDVDFTGGSLVQFNFAKRKEKTHDEVKATVSGELLPQFQARLETASGALRELANSNKSGEELLKDVRAKLPSLSQTQLGSAAELNATRLNGIADELDRVLTQIREGKLSLVSQPFGTFLEDSGAERRYRSFTLTTRVNHPAAIDILDDQLLKVFEAAIEPPTFEVKENALRVRLAEGESGGAPIEEERLRRMIEAEKSRLAARQDNLQLRSDIRRLAFEGIKTEPYGEGIAAGRPYIDMGPLPEDPDNRARMVTLIEEMNLKLGDRDLHSDGPVSRKASFGEAVSGQMFLTALFALLASMAGIFAYLWFRFEFTGAWGFGAIAALLHDAVLAIGGICFVNAFGLMPVLIDLNVVAAVLTIIGYSVNDTIVIFDRIREVKSAHPTRDLTEIINEAVNATLSRTILTSSLTLLSVLSLLIFGGETIRGLAFTLFVGMVFGIYSTVFIASPLMMWWYKRSGGGAAMFSAAKPKEPSPALEGAQV